MDNSNSQLDPKVLNLAKSIKLAETGSGDTYKKKGGSGEFGAYQFMPDTYKTYAQKYLGDSNAQPTIENQNKIAYSFIKEKKDQGFNPSQIASMWNAGEKKPNAYKENWKGVNSHGVAYDTPAYALKVSEYYKKLNGNQPGDVTHETPQPEIQKESGGPAFPSSPTDTPLQAGAKALGNTPGSIVNFGKGILHALNPLETLRKLMEIPGAYKEARDAGASIGDIAKELPGEAYKGLVPEGVRDVLKGDIAGAQKKFTEDPFGTVAPVVLAGVGGVKGLATKEALGNEAAMADYVKNIGENVNKPIPQSKTTFQNASKAIDTGISKTSGLITKPISAVTSKIGSGINSLTTSLASHITSLDPATIKQILSNPKEFSKIAQEQTSRGGLAGEVKSAIDTRLKDLSETGKGYDAIRNSTQVVQAPNFIADVLASKGLKLKNGKIIADTNSVTRNTADINALQKFYDNWGNKTTMTPNEFLNMRGDIAELSKFDKLTGMGKTRASEAIGKALYEKSNEKIRNTQLEELKALDNTYSPEVQFLKQVKKDYFNKDGTFKDNAPSKIANAGNKAELLKRLEAIAPGITKRIEILKAVEDIDSAMGRKVGTYTRGILQGGAILSGNMPAIIATIITHPTNAVKILRAAGYTAKSVGPIVNTLRIIGGDVKLPSNAGLISAPVNQLQP